MDIHKRLSRSVRREMRQQISAAGGNEVFFTGTVDELNVVTSVAAMARGREHEVAIHRAAARDAAVVLHNHPGGDLTPSDADMCAAADASERGQGFYIVNNSVTDIYVVIEPVLPQDIRPIDEAVAAHFISAGGPLSLQSENFEVRPVQVALLRAVTRVFNERQIGVFEAGTGVGKSYAYLIPALLWAATNKERVVISTGTINLQQQLFQKDIPAAKKITGANVRAVLVKGRQNYVCRRRLSGAVGERDMFTDDADEIEKIAAWAETSATGSRSDLSFVPHESAWSRIRSEHDACMGMRCPYHQQCFVMKVRKDAAAAQLVVVNHHLLFADIEMRLSGAGYDDQAVLPPYRHIIFDEAHGIEDAATSFFSSTTNRFQLTKLVNQLYRRRRDMSAGHLYTLAIMADAEDTLDGAYALTERIKNNVVNIELSALDLLQEEQTFRLCAHTAQRTGAFLSLAASLAESIGNFAAFVRDIMDAISEDDRTIDAYWEARLVLRRLDGVIKLFSDFRRWSEQSDTVFWLQRRRLPPNMLHQGEDGLYVTFTETPLDITSLMTGGVFEPMASVICTSATLTVGGSFDWWMRRSGVQQRNDGRLVAKAFPSPFPYEKNMLFCVPRDAPFPDKPVEYEAFVARAVPRLIRASQGRTLVLFTSYESLNNTYRAAQATLRNSRLCGPLLKQGDDDAARLLNRFREEEESVLFATDSFWQGVDVPGAALSQVIISKLPFPVPSDPVFMARGDAIERRGGNPFMALSVPEAVVQFRQGVGRLIRRSTDRGVVVLLDRRIYEKRYGTVFINSIPESKRRYETLEESAAAIESFLFDS
ncbi:MAG: ATP-dependent DNA helicase [Treponema sp.]|nr:ATP-dependent DNA helicase [Treponema sp.]